MMKVIDPRNVDIVHWKFGLVRNVCRSGKWRWRKFTRARRTEYETVDGWSEVLIVGKVHAAT